jgi:hypothetical protein
MKIQLGDFNAKVGRENIVSPTNGNESQIQEWFEKRRCSMATDFQIYFTVRH